MNKTSILSALALASAAPLNAETIQSERTQALQEIDGLRFESAETFVRRGWNSEVGEYQDFRYQLRLRFQPAEINYDLNGEPSDAMEYEVLVEHVDLASGEVTSHDTVYLAKRLADGKFKLYDCNSTANCYDDINTSVFYAFDTPNGKGLKFRDSADVLYTPVSRVVFNEIF